MASRRFVPGGNPDVPLSPEARLTGAPDTTGGEPLSICVPACNEARGIPDLLTSVFAQDYGGEFEVIVLANGCTDGTEDVVREFARSRPVRLLVTDVRGKPNAWNLLLEEARTELVVFADADVRLEGNALSALARRVRGPDRPVAVGALSRPETTGCDYLTRILNPPPRDHGCIVGSLYIVDRVALRARLEERGYEEMPRDVISEDSWLSILLGRGRWTTEPAAIVEYRPARWSELLGVQRRIVRGERQFLTEYAHLLEGPTDEALWLNESRHQRWERRRERWKGAQGTAERLGIVLNFLAKRLIRRLAELQVAREGEIAIEQAWERAEYSKRGFPDTRSPGETT